MDQSNNEYVIKVKDVLYVILKKLWIMLLVGVIAGGTLFTYYFRKVETVKTNDVLDITKKISASETEDQYKLRVQKIERAKDIYTLLNNVEHQIEIEQFYIDNSIYMRIDPDNNYFTTAQYTITIENNDVSGIDQALLIAYERYFKYSNYLDDYAEEIGERPDYIRELIGFSSESAKINNVIVGDDSEGKIVGTINLFVYGPSREFVNSTMDIVVTNLVNISKDLNSKVAKHSLDFVGRQEFVRVDSGLRTEQNSHYERLRSLREQMISYYSSLDAIATDLGLSSKTPLINYINKLESVEISGFPTETSEQVVSSKSKVGPNLKWFGIGFGGGALLVAIFIAIGYVFGKKVLTQAQFFGLFRNIRRIGVMKPLGKRSWFTRFIDVKSEDDTKTSIDNCNGLISSNYLNLTKDLNRVLITGTGDKKAMNEAYKALGLKGDFKPDIFSNPDVLKTVPDYDGIVIIEQRKVSLKPVIENEIELLSNGGTKIIGAIII